MGKAEVQAFLAERLVRYKIPESFEFTHEPRRVMMRAKSVAAR